MRYMTAVVATLLALGVFPAAAETLYGVPALSREDFNRLAAQAALPLFWQGAPGASDALEASRLVPVGAGAGLLPYVRDGALTEDFRRAYLELVQMRRLEAVRRELDFGKPSLIESDFRSASAEDRALVRHMAMAGLLIEELYLEQRGALAFREALPADDAASVALFLRNQGPWCEAPKTERDPFCNAAASFPAKRSDAYPRELAEDEALCKSLGARPDGRKLLDPFTVVRREGGELKAVPLTEAYGAKMRLVARELRAAAKSQGAGEPALVKYLLAAAKGFETNDWAEADEAWVAMNGRNSRWYLRVGPDETGIEPCEEKAAFHLAFAKVDPASLAWQDRLGPLKQEMEDALAALAGSAYTARKVAFNFPDFIEIVLNAGDSRSGLGAIMGQSLPNWGKVAQENRRRTVAMTNLYEDPDSKRSAREKAAELLDSEALRWFGDDREPGLVGVILHEAAHNFGPHSDTRVGGRTPTEIFGGGLEGVLEELKAQTAALWYVDFLRRKGLLSEDRAKQVYVHELAWCFGHLSKGLFTAAGSPKPYSQLSAIQIGWLAREGALEWVQGEDGAGRFRVRLEKIPAAVESLMRKTVVVKATGDAVRAKELVEDFVSGPGLRLVHLPEIQERLLRYPKESFLYSVRY